MRNDAVKPWRSFQFLREGWANRGSGITSSMTECVVEFAVCAVATSVLFVLCAHCPRQGRITRSCGAFAVAWYPRIARNIAVDTADAVVCRQSYCPHRQLPDFAASRIAAKCPLVQRVARANVPRIIPCTNDGSTEYNSCSRWRWAGKSSLHATTVMSFFNACARHRIGVAGLQHPCTRGTV